MICLKVDVISLEYHVDLRCWMAVASKVMHKLAQMMKDEQWLPHVEKERRQLIRVLAWPHLDQPEFLRVESA